MILVEHAASIFRVEEYPEDGVACFSETSLYFYQTAWCHIPESNLPQTVHHVKHNTV
jgi:hypothetical protein